MERFGRILIIVLWAVMLFVGWNGILSQTEPGLSLDDGYIHLEYAKNLLSGHFFQFNIGETSSGSTSPLWVFLLTLFGAAFGLMPAAFILSALSFLIAGLSAYFLCKKIILAFEIDDEITPFFAAITVLLYGRFFWHTFSGMETQLFSAVVAFSLGLFIAEATAGKKNLWSAMLAGIAIFIRPETFLLYVILILGYLFIHRKNFEKAILPISIIIGFSLLYFIFNLSLTGHLLPNTFFSKNALYRGDRWDYLSYTLFTFWHDNFALVIALVASSLTLLYMSFKSKKFFALAPLLWLFGLPLAKFMFSFQEVHFGRYTIVIVPSLAAVAVSAVAFLKNRWEKMLVPFVILLPAIFGLNMWLDMPARTVKQINTIHGETAKWILENTSDSALVAAHDVGRIKFDTERKILDLAGLTSNEVTMMIWKRRKELHHTHITFDSIAAKLLLEHHPDIIVSSPVWFPYLTANRSALKFLCRTYQYINSVECVPELDVYKLLPGADSTIFQFQRYGFHPDKQWLLNVMLPSALNALFNLKNISKEEQREYIAYLRQQNGNLYPYFNVSFYAILDDFIRWKMFSEGLVIATFGCALYPGDAVLWNFKGALLSQTKQFVEASKAFSNAVAIEPDVESFRLNYAITLLNSDDTIGAKAQIDSLLTKNPENKMAKKIMNAIVK